MPPITCDMDHDCTEPVTHLDEDGWVYCTTHGIQRQQGGWKRCRKMRPHELLRVEHGLQIAY